MVEYVIYRYIKYLNGVYSHHLDTEYETNNKTKALNKLKSLKAKDKKLKEKNKYTLIRYPGGKKIR